MYCFPSLRSRAVDIALKENKTLTAKMPERIQTYRDSIGAREGTDWCVAFVYWCYQQAAEELKVCNPVPKQGSSSRLLKFAEAAGLLADSPQSGDIYVSKKKSHTGMIAYDNPDFQSSKTETIEGNTWVGKESNKVWGVHKRKKNLNGAYFIRF